MPVTAYVGFSAVRHDTTLGGHRVIASGHWGCGAFGNNEKVMFVVQSLAADLAGVELRYHCPEAGRVTIDTDSRKASVDLSPAIQLLEGVRGEQLTVRAALDRLAERCASDPEWRPKQKVARPRKASCGKSDGEKGDGSPSDHIQKGRGRWVPSDIWRKGASV